MTPQIGQKIKIWLRNGLQIEGVVQSWSDHKSVLISPENTSCLVITNTVEDVIMYKLALTNRNQIEQSLQQEQSKYHAETDLINLAKLKKQLYEVEQEEYLAHSTSHVPSDIKPVQYGIPNVTTSTPKYPTQESRTQDSGTSTSLSNLFRKKS